MRHLICAVIKLIEGMFEVPWVVLTDTVVAVTFLEEANITNVTFPPQLHCHESLHLCCRETTNQRCPKTPQLYRSEITRLYCR